MKIIFALLALAAIAASAIAASPPQNADNAKQAATAPAGKSATAMPLGHTSDNTVPIDLENIKVTKAGGTGAQTVAEVIINRAKLKGEVVVIRGQVVRFNPEILNKNWIHLRDGSGSAADNTNDLLVTTNDQAKVGDIVVVRGVVHTDKDIGSGYSYKVLIEDAALRK